MTTTPLLSAHEGFYAADQSKFFDNGLVFPVLTTAVGLDYFAIYQFTHPGSNTTYWIDASTGPTPEFSLSLPILGGNGTPFYLLAATRIDGDQNSYPTTDAALANTWWLEVHGEQAFAGTPTSGTSRGLLAAKQLITSVASNTLTVPLDMGAFIPCITHQSWSRSIYLTLWIRPAMGGSSAPQLFPDTTASVGGNASSLLLPSETLAVPNRDTGRSGNARAPSSYVRDPISGFTLLRENLVPDGFRKGMKVDPRQYDEPDLPRRPVRPERP